MTDSNYITVEKNGVPARMLKSVWEKTKAGQNQKKYEFTKISEPPLEVQAIKKKVPAIELNPVEKETVVEQPGEEKIVQVKTSKVKK